MENVTQPNVPSVQPLSQTPTPVPSHTNWLKIILFILLGLIVVAGSVFAGIQIGKKQIVKQQSITEQPIIPPTQIVVNPTVIPTTTLPTELNPTINPTADWKTYTNQQHQFSLKYPRVWFTSVSGDGTILFDKEKIDGLNVVEPNQVSITMEVITNKELFETYMSNVPEDKSEQVVNGVKFTLFEPIYQNGQPPKTILFAQTLWNNKLFRLGLTVKGDSRDTFNQILSTFKFSN